MPLKVKNMLFDIPINNLGLAVVTLLGCFACALFIVKGIFLGLFIFVEWLR